MTERSRAVRVQRVETWLIEIPTRRPHHLAFGEITSLHYVICRRAELTSEGD